MIDPRNDSVVAAVKRRLLAEHALRVGALLIPWLALCGAWWQLAGPWVALALAAAGTVLFAPRAISLRRHADAPLTLEQRVPSLQNLLITAIELCDGQLSTSSEFEQAVFSEAGVRVARVSPREVVPLRRAMRLLAGSTVVAIFVLTFVGALAQHRAKGPRTAADAAAADLANAQSVSFTVRIVPPAYLREPARELRNAERLDVLEGSLLEVTSEGANVRWVPERGAPTRTRGTLRVLARLDGFIALERDERVARVVPVSLRRDGPPRIAIEKPEGDLLLRTAVPLRIQARASDDHALASAELRYTRVSGSGEQFEFDSGVLPVRANRDSPRSWSLEADLPLLRLGASPGDAIVFRIAARDARGAAGEGLSDALLVEIVSPAAALSTGAAIDPTEDKFALSQQMILLKLRRLHAARRSLHAEAVLEQSQALAAEQRTVRALFVFMLGGEIEDEEVEAAHSQEIQEGRLQDSSRRDLVNAINLMSRVERHLVATETGAAIPPAQAAVEAVQRAFGRRRYFLRTTPVRMRIDPSRRLAGDTRDAVTLRLSGSRTAVERQAARAMDDLIRLAASDGAVNRDQLATAAAALMQIDPRAPELQQLAAEIQRVDPRPPAELRNIVSRALAALASRERARHPGQLEPEAVPHRLKSAWTERWRRGGVQP